MIKRDKYFGMSPRIARWKLDNPFENWLSYKADNSEFWKAIYVFYYKLFDAEYYYGGLRFINNHLATIELPCGVDRKSVTRDMIYCLHRFGISFQDYCIYDFLNNRSVLYRDSFVADKLRYYYCDILNDNSIMPLMTNKYACYNKFKEFYKRSVVGCFDISDKNNYIDFIAKNDSFIYKPLNEHSGRGIELLYSKGLNPNHSFDYMLAKGPFILEEVIIQGNETAKMHQESVNSLRVLTFRINNVVKILGVTWRIGRGSSVMDNAGAGGIYAGVDPVSGIVETSAINYRGEEFYVHPDSNLPIIGYQLPEWDDALLLINSLAMNLDGATLISWDIAYSDKGWLMIEANDNGDWSIIQSNRKEGKKDVLYELMDSYLKE